MVSAWALALPVANRMAIVSGGSKNTNLQATIRVSTFQLLQHPTSLPRGTRVTGTGLALFWDGLSPHFHWLELKW